MADLSEFPTLCWTESGQDLDGWGYPTPIPIIKTPAVLPPPIFKKGPIHQPLHTVLHGRLAIFCLMLDFNIIF